MQGIGATTDLTDENTGPPRRAVVHVAESLATGVLEVVRTLANHTASIGVPTVIVYGRRPGTPRDLAGEFDGEVRLVEVPNWGDRRPAQTVAAMVRAGRVLRGELARYDGGIVHLHSSFAGFLGRLGVVGRNWRLVYSPHGYSFEYESVPPLTRKLVRVSESVLGRRGETIAVSNAEGEEAARIVGEERVLVVQSGVDLPELPPANAESSRFVVTLLGRAAVHRRPQLVADLARRLGSELGAEFVWLGDGPDRGVLASGGVDVRGWQPRDELGAALLRSDVVLHLSSYEGFPIAVLEAMAAARPVVASDLPAIREALGDAGILLADDNSAAEEIRRLHGDPGLREELGRQARARVERFFTKDRMVERALAAYGLDSSARPPSDT